MNPTPAQLAEALSGHRFDDVIPFLSADVRWELVGELTLHGRDDVVDALRGTAAELAGTATDFTRFVVVATDTDAVVDAVAIYTTSDGDRSVVASCDVYEFSDGFIAGIRSYNVELD